MKAYMRGQFDYLGIKTPQRKALYKAHKQAHGLPPIADVEMHIRTLWAQPEREFQHVALQLLFDTRKHHPADFAQLFEDITLEKPWWDTIDFISSHHVAELWRRMPDVKAEWLPKWRTSDNFWLRRVCLLHQLRYKDQMDEALLFALVEENLGSTEFFINKAIGWALREYSKFEPERLQTFVAETALAPLSQREALKWIERKRK